MKRLGLFFLGSLLLVSSANAVVLDTRPSPRYRLHEAKYVLNPELGRAWLVLDYVLQSEFPSLGRRHRRPRAHETYRVQVPGMTYNRESHEVLMGNVVCARVRNVDSFWGDYLEITPTGHCPIRSEIVARDIDDGYHITRQEFVQVSIDSQ
jgi:hypothetical protein